MNRKEQQRKRRAKRKAKKAKWEWGRLPRFIACHYLMDKPQPVADDLLDAFECAKDRSKWITPPYRPVGSEPCQCWNNVARAVSLWGGKMVCGWSFRIDPMDGFNNCMADIEAIPHAVWCDENGDLFEVSEDCCGAYFQASFKVRPFLAINVGFTDNEMQARTYRPADPFLMSVARNFYIRAKGQTA